MTKQTLLIQGSINKITQHSELLDFFFVWKLHGLLNKYFLQPRKNIPAM